MDSRGAAWGLEDEGGQRERYIKPAKGPTELTAFRISAEHARKLDEVIQCGIDPRIKTKTDALQDAVYLFLMEWYSEYGDFVPGTTLRQFRLEQQRILRERRRQYLDLVDDGIEISSDNRDVEELKMIRKDLITERDEKVGKAPDYYIDELDKRLNRVKRILS